MNPRKDQHMAEHKNEQGSSNRGFASMDEDKQREIASKGGSSVPKEERSFSKDHELAAEAGRKGGEASHGGHGHSGKEDSKATSHTASGHGGNFADDPERAAEAGRKGGHASHGGK
jgi:general stress protein YciG